MNPLEIFLSSKIIFIIDYLNKYMSKKTILQHCSITEEELLERYKSLINKIAQKTLSEKDIEGFPLDYAPKSRRFYLSMMSKNDCLWTLAESWVVHHKESPPDFLIFDMNFSHNSVFFQKHFLCWSWEVEKPLTLKLLIKSIVKGKVNLF